jgi:dTDP-4-dehydrorhamnose reductase
MKKNEKYLGKIYIAGCGGMLGEAFYKQFNEDYKLKCTDIDVNENWLSYLDFRDYEAYKNDVFEYKPDYLFHLGAYTDLEYCENHVNDTYLTNTLAAENAVYIANELDIPLVFISTAGIFAGDKDIYDDWDTPAPLGVYAKTKYEGELYVKYNVKPHLIFRAGWMMGGGPNKDKKFVNKILKQLKEGKKELYVVHDKMGTPTYTHDFAKNLRLVLEKKLWGLYNMVCDGFTSRLEVANEIISILGLRSKIKIIEVTSDYFKQEYFAQRPQSERLINKKLILRNLNIMRDWKVALKEYIEQYYSDYL